LSRRKIVFSSEQPVPVRCGADQWAIAVSSINGAGACGGQRAAPANCLVSPLPFRGKHWVCDLAPPPNFRGVGKGDRLRRPLHAVGRPPVTPVLQAGPWPFFPCNRAPFRCQGLAYAFAVLMVANGSPAVNCVGIASSPDQGVRPSRIPSPTSHARCRPPALFPVIALHPRVP